MQLGTLTPASAAIEQTVRAVLSGTPTIADVDGGSQGLGAGLQNSGTATIGVTAVNDAPTVAGAGGSTAYTEQAAAVAIATGLTRSGP